MHSCGKCTVKWSGMEYAHCATCHVTFGRVSTFDAHRRNGRCLSVRQMAATGIQESASRPGIWVRGMSEDALARVSG